MKRERKNIAKPVSISLKWLIVLVFAFIISCTIGYSALNQELRISGEANLIPKKGDVIIALSVDGTASDTYPSKGSGYSGKVSCDNEATGVWDESIWGLTVTNLSKRPTTCNIDFSKGLGTTLLAQYGGVSAITEAPASLFSSISTETENAMYKMEDEYGTSYYYRGAKDLINNNIIFANFQWKIVRINGDGSIRLIYNGTCPNSSCTINSTGTATQIGSYIWNTTNSKDNKYVGYMYGGANGTASTSLSNAQTNETNSNAKTTIDNWYLTNIQNKGFSSYVVDNIFCNDRQLQSEVGGSSTGTGYETSTTYYAAYYRLYSTKTPKLKCANINNQFTIASSSKGNKALTYPVGLITADEVALSGGLNNTANSTFYLYTAQYFRTMSASAYTSSGASMWDIPSNGSLGSVTGYVTDTRGFRPVINLKSSVQITGSGTTSSPYIVK